MGLAISLIASVKEKVSPRFLLKFSKHSFRIVRVQTRIQNLFIVGKSNKFTLGQIK